MKLPLSQREIDRIPWDAVLYTTPTHTGIFGGSTLHLRGGGRMHSNWPDDEVKVVLDEKRRIAP